MLKARLKRRQKEKIWQMVDKTSGSDHGCWEWRGSKTKEGYGQSRLSVEGTPKTYFAHRLIYELTYGVDITGKVIRHVCNNPTCVNPKHLRVGDHRLNVRDRVLAKRGAVGESNGRAVLTELQVSIIKKLLVLGATAYEIEKITAVSERAIANIANGKTWGHVAARPLHFV